MKTGIKIVKAVHIKGYQIELTFSDGRVNIVDFEKTIMSIDIQGYKKYKNIEEFKKFKIELGDIVWGENWDLIFPLYKLYENTLDVTRGRKKVVDKKATLRLYIPESIINAHGGLESARQKASQFLMSIA